MDIAVTLVIQGIAFFLVLWVVMRFGWPYIIKAIEERQKKIAEGLAAANRGQKDLDEARQRLVAQAHEEIALDVTRAREGLRKQVATLAVQGASHLLEREIDPQAHADLLDKLELEIARG